MIGVSGFLVRKFASGTNVTWDLDAGLGIINWYAHTHAHAHTRTHTRTRAHTHEC